MNIKYTRFRHDDAIKQRNYFIQSNCVQKKSEEIKSINNIATTAGSNPSGRLSFKGLTPKPNLAKNLINKKWFETIINIASSNTLVAEAIFALFLTAGLRPLVISSLPSKVEDDKTKNKYQSAHSIATGFMGLATTLAISEPLKRGTDFLIDSINKQNKDFAKIKIKLEEKLKVETDKKEIKKLNKELRELPDKEKLANYIKKNYPKLTPEFIKQNGLFKELGQRILVPVYYPLRAMATIAIIPVILKNVFKIEKPKKQNINSFAGTKPNNNKLFNDFIKPKTDNNVSFKGANPVTKIIAKGTLKVSATKGFDKILGFLKTGKFKTTEEIAKEKTKKIECGFPIIVASESALLSAFYSIRTAKQKTIEKDQKLPMILNQSLVTLLCTIGAFTIDGAVNKLFKNIQHDYKELFNEKFNKDFIPKLENEYNKNFNTKLDSKDKTILIEAINENNDKQLAENLKRKGIDLTEYVDKNGEKMFVNQKGKIKLDITKIISQEKIDYAKSLMEKEKEIFDKQAGNEKLKTKVLTKKLSGISLIKTIIIFTTIYRFIGPVIVTPIANKISNLIRPPKDQTKK